MNQAVKSSVCILFIQCIFRTPELPAFKKKKKKDQVKKCIDKQPFYSKQTYGCFAVSLDYYSF